MSLENITEFDEQFLSEFCKRNRSTSAMFYVDKDPSISFDAHQGKFIDLSTISSDPSTLKSLENQKAIRKYRSLLIELGKITDIIQVAFDDLDPNNIITYIVFSTNYRDYRSELRDKLFDYKIQEDSMNLDVVPLSVDEFNRDELPSRAIVFTRTKKNVQ